MKDIIISLLGEYQTKTDTNGNIIGGLAGLDYEYIIGALCFVLMVFIIVKTISSLIVAGFKG